MHNGPLQDGMSRIANGKGYKTGSWTSNKAEEFLYIRNEVRGQLLEFCKQKVKVIHLSSKTG